MIFAVEIDGVYLDVNEINVFAYCKEKHGIDVDYDFEELEVKLKEVGITYEGYIE